MHILTLKKSNIFTDLRIEARTFYPPRVDYHDLYIINKLVNLS